MTELKVKEAIPIVKISIAIWLPILILLLLVGAILLLVYCLRRQKDDIVQVIATNDKMGSPIGTPKAMRRAKKLTNI